MEMCKNNRSKISVNEPGTREGFLIFVCLFLTQTIWKDKTCKISPWSGRPWNDLEEVTVITIRSHPLIQPYALHHPSANQVAVLIPSPWMLSLLPQGLCSALHMGCSLSFHNSITARDWIWFGTEWGSPAPQIQKCFSSPIVKSALQRSHATSITAREAQ